MHCITGSLEKKRFVSSKHLLFSIGLIHENLGNCSQALSAYEQTIEVYQHILPTNHSNLAAFHNNIDNVYFKMGQRANILIIVV
jgi:tetratricopeptide (TPR) repeat protein